MFYANQRRQILSRAIFSMWANWAIGVGCIALLIISAPWLTSRFVPVLAVVLEFMLLYLERKNEHSNTPSCFRIPHIAQTVMFITAISLIPIILHINTGTAREFTGEAVNVNNPIIPVLLTGPIATLVCLFYIIRGRKKNDHCRGCHHRSNDSGDRSILTWLYVRESWFQIKFLFLLSIMITIVGWCYYWFYFINVSINKADTFVYTAIPVAVYLMSLLYLGTRYYSIHLYYCHNEGLERYISRSGTAVRFMLLCGDKMLVTIPNSDIATETTAKIDTPLKYLTPFRDNIPLHEAEAYFHERIANKNIAIKELYSSHDYGMYYNTFHFVAYIDPDDMEKVAKETDAVWLSIHEIDMMIQSGLLANELVSEIRRIHTMVMAWKTYDNRGFRLYPIKHYTPTFRITEMPKWDIDFNDANWLYVAEFNEDKPFFRLRRYWNRLIKGRGN